MVLPPISPKLWMEDGKQNLSGREGVGGVPLLPVFHQHHSLHILLPYSPPPQKKLTFLFRGFINHFGVGKHAILILFFHTD